MVGSLENLDNIMLRLANGTRPSIWPAWMPRALSMLARISSVWHHDVKTMLSTLRTSKHSSEIIMGRYLIELESRHDL